jgi:hypothetical protein
MKNNDNENKVNIMSEFCKIDEPLRINITKNLEYGFFTLIISFVFAIWSKEFKLCIAMLIAILVYSSFFIYVGLKYLDGEVKKYTGECIGISKRVRGEHVTRNYVTIKIDKDTLLRVYNDRMHKKSHLNDTMAIYIPSSALYQLNENTYATNSSYFFYTVKSSVKASENIDEN